MAVKKKKKAKVKKKKVAKRKGPPPNPNKWKLEDGVTQSMLTSFLSCRQKFRYQQEGYEIPGGSSALRFGSMVHAFTELIHKDFMEYGISPIAKDCERYGQLYDLWAPDYIDEMMKEGLGKSDLDEMDTFIAIAEPLIRAYCKNWKKDWVKSRWHSVESCFNVPFAGDQVLYGPVNLRGMRDAIQLRKRKLWLFETKTFSRDAKNISDTLMFDFQNLFYLTATELEIGKPLEGVVYNQIRRPQLKQGESSHDEYIERIADDIAERTDFYFIRYEVDYPEKVLAAFQAELSIILIEFQKYLENEGPVYKNTQACTGKYNCPYIGACATGSMGGYTRTNQFHRELHDQEV